MALLHRCAGVTLGRVVCRKSNFAQKRGRFAKQQTTRAGRVEVKAEGEQARLLNFQYPNLPGGGGLRIVYHIRGSNNATQLAA